MNNAEKKLKRRRGWQRFFLSVCLILLLMVFAGFFVFAYIVETQKQPEHLPNADGIVVWTGKGGGRLQAGADLLMRGRGERLLISGVNENNDRSEVLKLLNLDANLADCCVDLDYAAIDTIGNARETAKWSEALGYEHIILVTSAYHMPRAETEISAARGRIRITPYPVFGDRNARWWNDFKTFKRLSQEYGKLLLAYLRRMGAGTVRGTPLLEDMPPSEGVSE